MDLARSVMIHGAVPVHRLLSHGVTRHQVAAAVRAGALARIRAGVLIDAQQWSAGDADSRLRTAIAAAHAARPGGVACAGTAATLWTLPSFDIDHGSRARGKGGITSILDHTAQSIVAGHPIPRVHFAVPGDGERSGWLHMHNIAVPSHLRCVVDGIPVTTLARSAVDYALVLQVEQAVAVLDAAVRLISGMLEPERDVRRAVLDDMTTSQAMRSLVAATKGMESRHGATVLRRALELVNPASESVLESISRVNMVRGRLPVPECGQPVRGTDGVLYWCDFLWRSQRVIGEADGMAKYTALDDLRREKARQEALANAGWTVIRWNWAEGVVHPKVMQGRLRQALLRWAA